MLTQLFTTLSLMHQRRDERGASAVEYGLLVALIAAIIVASVLLLGNTLDGIFADTEACISTQTGC